MYGLVIALAAVFWFIAAVLYFIAAWSTHAHWSDFYQRLNDLYSQTPAPITQVSVAHLLYSGLRQPTASTIFAFVIAGFAAVMSALGMFMFMAT